MYSGYIKDSQTGEAIVRATVRLYNNGQLITQKIADGDGYFEISSFIPGTSITISAAEYQTWNFPASAYQHIFELERKPGELPPVFLPPVKANKNKNLWLLGLLALIIIKESK